MSILVLISILIRIVNFALSIVVLRQVRDWRLAFLPLMMILTVLRQTIHLVENDLLWRVSWAMPASEVPGLLLSCITFLLLLVLARIFKEREAFVLELESKNAELERFAYTVSHDLKSPLVTIRGFLGLLERDAAAGDTQSMRRDIDKINAAAATMARLLDELLDFSRIGRATKPAEKVALSELAREAAELVAGRIGESGVDVEIDPGLPTVTGDRRRLRELFQNLIDNAVKFLGDAAAPRVEIGQRDGQGEAVIFVRDNGPGIEPRYHEKVFGLFDRLDASVDGTGVGLAVVKRIVETHGGTIWIESQGRGDGSTFCFTLPGTGGV